MQFGTSTIQKTIFSTDSQILHIKRFIMKGIDNTPESR